MLFLLDLASLTNPYSIIILTILQVNDANLIVKTSDGTSLESQLVEVDIVTARLRKLYIKAYLGITSDKPPKYWLVFQASVPPLGWNTYFISKSTGTGETS